MPPLFKRKINVNQRNLMALLSIDDQQPLFTFVNVWETDTVNNQQRLVEAMKEETDEIQRQPGFVGMALHVSTDGKQVVVYAQWRSEDDFRKGVTENPVANKNRSGLAKFGRPVPNAFRLDSIFLATTSEKQATS